MPVTLSYDLQTDDVNQRTYIRSMLERFGWQRLGGSVFRYPGAGGDEDWLNQVVPSLMFFRSYILAKGITLRFFTLDASSISFVDQSDPVGVFGAPPVSGAALPLVQPTNNQSSVGAIQALVNAATRSIL